MEIDKTAENREKCIKECGFPYRFSVVMPVYMAQDYLRAAIESILNQTIGFEEYAQLILVDDGSPDESGAICDEYKSFYPNNIIVVHKANGGPSSARNAGLPYTEGRYVCFLDSDDKYSKKVMELVYGFFIEHENETDIVTINRTLFGAKKGPSSANINYGSGSCIIDLLLNYKILQPTLATSFIKQAIAKNICCDTELDIVEDRKEIFKIVSRLNRVGLVRGCTYYNRKREIDDSPSLTDQSTTTKSNYLPALKRYCQWAYDFYQEKMGYIPPHVQYMVVLYLRKKALLRDFPKGLLTDSEQAEYVSLLKEILLRTEDYIICGHKSLIPEAKNFLLYIKYGKWPKLTHKKKSVFLTQGNTVVYDVRRGKTLLDVLSITGDTLHVSGYLITLMPVQDVRIFLHVNNEYIQAELFRHHEDRYALGEKIACAFGFRANIPLNRDKKLMKIKVCLQLNNGAIVTRASLSVAESAPINLDQRGSYYFKDKWKLTATKKALYVRPCNSWSHIKSEFKLIRSLWRKNKSRSRRAILIRFVYYLVKAFKKREIWLFSDRIYNAEDNGEFFFRYLCSAKYRNIRPIFAIDKRATDFARLKKYGMVVSPHTFHYKILFLLADVAVSSYDYPQLTSPFGKGAHFYRDLYSDRVSSYLPNSTTTEYITKAFEKNQGYYDLIEASCIPEYSSILETLNGDGDSISQEVVLDGLPRFDHLFNDAKKVITILPASREYLFKGTLSKQGKRTANKGFAESKYCLFYSRLLNDRVLLEAAAQYGYCLRFIPHPDVIPYLDAFSVDESIEIITDIVNYPEQFAQSSLLVTDYSPAAFDFAYLRKPIIYFHFDNAELESTSANNLYLSSEAGIFGEIETTSDGTVAQIIDCMMTDCRLKQVYHQRIDEAFPHIDKNNCQRIFETIRDLEEKSFESSTEMQHMTIPRYYQKPSVDNSSVAFICNDLTEFYAMQAGIDALLSKNIPVAIFVSTNKNFTEMEEKTAETIKSLGYNVKANTSENVEYKILLEPYPMNISRNLVFEFRIKYSYGAGTSKPNPTFMPHRNLHFDAFIHFNKRDAEVRKVYGKAYAIPFFQYSTLEKHTHDGKPNLLYLPTFGDVCSVGYLDDKTVEGIKEKYNFLVKAHHAIQYREDEQDNFNRLIAIADEFYDSSTPITELLTKADVVLSDNSGAILDSIYSETPVAIFSKEPNQRKLGGVTTTHYELVHDGIVPCAAEADEILWALDQAEKLRDIQKEFKNRNYVYCDTDPTSVFVSLIEEYLAMNRTASMYFMAHDILLNDFIQKSNDVRTLKKQVNRLEQRVIDFENSSSWRVTRPIRNISRLLKKK